MKRGFTLLELIIVIIIIGILATLGFAQYVKVVEKGRTSEAKSILGQLRTAETAYFLENNAYTATIANLAVEAPTACALTHYFSYTCYSDGACRAARCTGGGKKPDSATAYNIDLTAVGVWSGTPGYF